MLLFSKIESDFNEFNSPKIENSVRGVRYYTRKKLIKNDQAYVTMAIYLSIITLFQLAIVLISPKIIDKLTVHSLNFTLDFFVMVVLRFFLTILTYPLTLGIFMTTLSGHYSLDEMFGYYKSLKNIFKSIVLGIITELPTTLLIYQAQRFYVKSISNKMPYAFYIILLILFILSIITIFRNIAMIVWIKNIDKNFAFRMTITAKVFYQNFLRFLHLNMFYIHWIIVPVYLYIKIIDSIPAMQIFMMTLLYPLMFGLGFLFYPKYYSDISNLTAIILDDSKK